MTPEEIKNHVCTNRQSTIDTFNKHKGEQVITNGLANKVLRFLGIGEDEDDYLYIYIDFHGKLSYETINCGIIPLKNKIDDDHYKRLIRAHEFNSPDVNSDKNIYGRSNPEIYKEVRKKILESIPKSITLMDELCWDLN